MPTSGKGMSSISCGIRKGPERGLTQFASIRLRSPKTGSALSRRPWWLQRDQSSEPWKLLQPEGILVTSSCSYHCRGGFLRASGPGIRDAHRPIQVLERRTQSLRSPPSSPECRNALFEMLHPSCALTPAMQTGLFPSPAPGSLFRCGILGTTATEIRSMFGTHAARKVKAQHLPPRIGREPRTTLYPMPNCESPAFGFLG